MEVGPLAIEAVDAAAETITMAFRHDPVWNVALVAADGSEGHLLPYWRLYVEGARRYDTVFASADAGAVSVWIHPEDPSCRMTRRPRCANWPSARSVRANDCALRALGPFRRAPSHQEAHAYLSLLATRPATPLMPFQQVRAPGWTGRIADAIRHAATAIAIVCTSGRSRLGLRLVSARMVGRAWKRAVYGEGCTCVGLL